MDWTAITALMATIAAVASMLMVLRMYRETRGERREMRFAVAVDSMWRLADEWGSPDLASARSSASASLLAGRAGDDIDAVLRFFDRMAFLSHHGGFDEELTWHEFYWPLVRYWFASQDYRRHLKPEDSARWDDLEALVQRLIAIEARHRKCSTDEAIPTKAQLREFLLAEVDAGECTDDDETEAGRTPL